MDFLDSAAHSSQCNACAILNSMKRSDLGLLLVPNFEELLFGEENPNTEQSNAMRTIRIELLEVGHLRSGLPIDYFGGLAMKNTRVVIDATCSILFARG
jgi:hypothetical protein